MCVYTRAYNDFMESGHEKFLSKTQEIHFVISKIHFFPTKNSNLKAIFQRALEG